MKIQFPNIAERVSVSSDLSYICITYFSRRGGCSRAVYFWTKRLLYCTPCPVIIWHEWREADDDNA